MEKLNKPTSKPVNQKRRSFIKTSTSALMVGSILPYSFSWAQGSKAINVGVIAPLSGLNAEFGTNSRQGIELVADEINNNGGIKALGGAKINLVVVDSTSTPTQAATVAQRLIANNNCVAILGAYASSLTLAVMQVTERRGVPLMTMSFSDEITESGASNVFQIVSKASVLGKAQLDYSIETVSRVGEAKKIAIMYEDTAYGTSQAKGLRNAAKERGIEIVMDEAYPPGISDVTPLVNKLRNSGAQVAFPVSYLNDSVLIIRTMRQQDIDMPTVGGAAGYVEPSFAETLGKYSEGVLSINTSNYDQDPELTDLYRKRFGKFMAHEALENAVCMSILAQSLEMGKTDDPAAIRKILMETKFTEGWARAMPGGAVKFNEKGLNELAEPLLVQWQDSELVTIYPDKYAKGKLIAESV